MVGRGGTKEEIMNAKPTRMLFAAVSLSALAAVLAGAAQARIPEGNGTRPPSSTVVDEQQAPEGSGMFYVDPEIYTALTFPTVVNEERATKEARVWGSEFFVDPELIAALTSPTVPNKEQTTRASGTTLLDPVYATLDPAIWAAIRVRSHATPLAAKGILTRKGNQRLEKFPVGYRGLP